MSPGARALQSAGRISCVPAVFLRAANSSDQNLPTNDLRVKAFEVSLSGVNPLAIQDVELPVMSAARQYRTVQMALDKSDPLMWAPPLIGTKLPVELEEKDCGIAHAETLHLAFPDVFDGADFHEIRLLGSWLHSPFPSDVEPLQRSHGEVLQTTRRGDDAAIEQYLVPGSHWFIR
jgi:hypothetical protein